MLCYFAVQKFVWFLGQIKIPALEGVTDIYELYLLFAKLYLCLFLKWPYNFVTNTHDLFHRYGPINPTIYAINRIIS